MEITKTVVAAISYRGGSGDALEAAATSAVEKLTARIVEAGGCVAAELSTASVKIARGDVRLDVIQRSTGMTQVLAYETVTFSPASQPATTP